MTQSSARQGESHLLLPNTDIEDMARVLAPLSRHLVSDGYDAALDALASRFPMRIHAYPTGISAFTWIVPERWLCREAALETLDGQKILGLS